MSKTIRIEMVMPSAPLAFAKFPEAESKFVKGVGGLALRAAGLKPSICLEGKVVVVEIVCRSEASAQQILPGFQARAIVANNKELEEKGSCIEMRVFLKEDS